MKKLIVPTIIAKNQKEFNKRYKKLRRYSKMLHLDVMDGKFVKNKSMWFWFKLPKHDFEAHLMIKEPELFIKTHIVDINKFIVHIETVKNMNNLIKLMKERKKKLFIALNPETPISKIKKYLNKIDGVMVLTVKPGSYGAKFMPSMLKKIAKLRKLKPKMEIQADGSITPKTIGKASKAGANNFSVGHYIQNNRNIKKALGELYIRTWK